MISSINSGYASLAQSVSRQDNLSTKQANSNEAKSSTELSPKAAAIAKSLANGEYKLDLKATAKAMASELA